MNGCVRTHGRRHAGRRARREPAAPVGVEDSSHEQPHAIDATNIGPQVPPRRRPFPSCRAPPYAVAADLRVAPPKRCVGSGRAHDRRVPAATSSDAPSVCGQECRHAGLGGALPRGPIDPARSRPGASTFGCLVAAPPVVVTACSFRFADPTGCRGGAVRGTHVERSASASTGGRPGGAGCPHTAGGQGAARRRSDSHLTPGGGRAARAPRSSPRQWRQAQTARQRRRGSCRASPRGWATTPAATTGAANAR